MAGPAVPEPKPDLGWMATLAAFIFVAIILTGFGVATASSYDNEPKKKDDKETEKVEDGEESLEEGMGFIVELG